VGLEEGVGGDLVEVLIEDVALGSEGAIPTGVALPRRRFLTSAIAGGLDFGADAAAAGTGAAGLGAVGATLGVGLGFAGALAVAGALGAAGLAGGLGGAAFAAVLDVLGAAAAGAERAVLPVVAFVVAVLADAEALPDALAAGAGRVVVLEGRRGVFALLIARRLRARQRK
jgi:hypothetical protein